MFARCVDRGAEPAGPAALPATATPPRAAPAGTAHQAPLRGRLGRRGRRDLHGGRRQGASPS